MNTSPLRSLVLAAACVTVWVGSDASAALTLNAPQPITHKVTVQAIVVSNDGGTNTATFMGSTTQEASIMSLVDDIWAQAGIDIDWLAEDAWNSTFANEGNDAPYVLPDSDPNTVDDNPRPQSDLSTIVSNANTAGKLHADPLVLNMFFVNVSPGHYTYGTNTAAGLAQLPGNDSTMYVGSALPGFLNGREAVASVIAHEIGHNLGLPHVPNTPFNLMQPGGSESDGEQLSESQITTAQNSQYSVLVPEPATLPIFAAALLLLARRRRRAA